MTVTKFCPQDFSILWCCCQCTFHLSIPAFSRKIIHGKVFRNMPTYTIHKAGKIITPANSNNNVTDGIFYNQSPTYNPGNQLTKGCISISICTAGDGNTRCKLCITHGREGTGYCYKNKEKYHSRTSCCTCIAYGTENTGTNDGRNAHRR